MKIQSKFKDYYDHIAHIYGGGDPLNVYERKPLEDTHYDFDPVLFNNFRLPGTYHREDYLLKYIVVAGKMYTLRADKNPVPGQLPTWLDYKLFTPENFPKSFEEKKSKGFRKWRWLGLDRPVVYIGYDHPALTEISKKIGQPVYELVRVTNWGPRTEVWLNSVIPILAAHGIPSIISAEQMYQDLSYYTVNTMKESPDIRKPNISSDKDKVLQHGFDIKQSFRHRV